MEPGLHLAPQLPTAKMFESIHRLVICTDTGIVDGPYKKNIGNIDKHGHAIVNIWDGKKQKKIRRCHLIWWAATGEWPTSLIDHENRVKADDRYSNLRMRTHRQNMVNKIGSGDLLVGVKPSDNLEYPFQCVIKHVYVGRHLGYFKTESEANEQYSLASDLIAQAVRRALEELASGRA